MKISTKGRYGLRAIIDLAARWFPGDTITGDFGKTEYL